jgi:hypothetical protein
MWSPPGGWCADSEGNRGGTRETRRGQVVLPSLLPAISAQWRAGQDPAPVAQAAGHPDAQAPHHTSRPGIGCVTVSFDTHPLSVSGATGEKVLVCLDLGMGHGTGRALKPLALVCSVVGVTRATTPHPCTGAIDHLRRPGGSREPADRHCRRRHRGIHPVWIPASPRVANLSCRLVFPYRRGHRRDTWARPAPPVSPVASVFAGDASNRAHHHQRKGATP